MAPTGSESIGIWPFDKSQKAWDRTYKILIGVIRRPGIDAEWILDAVLFAMTKAWQREKTFSHRDNIMAWMCIVAQNRLKDLLKGRSREKRGIDSPDKIIAPDPSYTAEIIHKYLGRLLPEDAEILCLFHLTHWPEIVARIAVDDRYIPDLIRFKHNWISTDVRLTDGRLGDILFQTDPASANALLQRARLRRLQGWNLLHTQLLDGQSHPKGAQSILCALWECIQDIPSEERLILEVSCFGNIFDIGEVPAIKRNRLNLLDPPIHSTDSPDTSDLTGILALDVAIGLVLFSQVGVSPRVLGDQVRIRRQKAEDDLRRFLDDDGIDPDEWP
jgi:hypothetical protein